LLSRWSRLKRDSTAQGTERPKTPTTPGPDAASPDVPGSDDLQAGGDTKTGTLPELPPLESLTPDSDFRVFMDPRVEDGVRRTALKTLFRSPGFNVTDGLDEYAADYTKLETLTPAMVAALRHTQRMLFGKQEEPGDNRSARSDVAPGDDLDLADEVRSDEQRDGKDPGRREAGDEPADGVATVISLDDAAGGSAAGRSTAKPDGRTGSKLNE